MPHSTTQTKRLAVSFVGVGLLIGVGVGWVLAPSGLRAITQILSESLPQSTSGHSHAESGTSGEDHGHQHEEMELGENEVAITQAAAENTQLDVKKVYPSDGYRFLEVPGDIIELPGSSNHVVTTPVMGVVVGVHAVPGEAVRSGEKLFSVRLTGEAMATAQAQLLDTLQQIKNTQAELDRLAPVEAAGSLAVKTRKALQYELARLEGLRSTRMQELLVRGLSEQQVDRIVTTGKLLRELTVTVPTHDESAGKSLQTEPRSPGDFEDWDFTVERLNVFPGKAVKPGDDLSHLAEHTRLQVCGHAFPQDVDYLKTTIQNRWPVSFEVDDEYGAASRNNLEIRYIDNHIDPETQTIGFYLPFRNEVLQDLRDEQGQTFRSWRFRPGQRVHVNVPVERFQQQFVLPPAAVVREGNEAWVFRRVRRQAAHQHAGETTIHPAMDVFRRVPVKVLHETTQQVVVSAAGELKAGNAIATGNAFQLQLALEKSAEGGGGHHHHHH